MGHKFDKNGPVYFIESNEGMLRIYAVDDTDAIDRGRAVYGTKLLRVLAPVGDNHRVVWAKA